jgi:hypothetical protein
MASLSSRGGQRREYVFVGAVAGEAASQGCHSIAVDAKSHTVWIAYAKDDASFVQPSRRRSNLIFADDDAGDSSPCPAFRRALTQEARGE